MIESIKITSLNNIGSNLSFTSVFPVVDINGTPITNKANLQIIGNYILSQAGGANFVQAAQATLAQSVTNAAQPNITSVGTLTSLAVSGNANITGNLNIAVNRLKIPGGTNGYVLQTDGTGNLTWTAQTGGGGGNGSPGGSNSQIQFNDAGSFGGDSGLTYNKTTDTLTTVNINAGNVDLTGNVNANWVIGDYVAGNANPLFYIPGGNVVGTVANANLTQYINIDEVSNNYSYHIVLSAGHGDKDLHIDGSDNLQYNPSSGLLTATRVDADNLVGNLYYSYGYPVANVDGIGNIATIDKDGNSSHVLLGNGVFGAVPLSSSIANGNSNFNIANSGGNATITTNGNSTWTFTDDGLLVFPQNHLYIDSVYNYLGTDTTLLQTAQDVPFLMLTDGPNSSLSSVWLANVNDPGNSRIAAIYANPTHNSGLVRIVTGNNASNTYIWDFDDTGNLTLPGNTFAINYANGTPVSRSASELVNGDESFALDADGNVVFQGLVSGGGVNRGMVWDYGANVGGQNSQVRQDGDGLTVRAWTENGGGANGYSAPVRIVTNQSGNEKQWIFDGQGNLTMPGNLIMATGNIESATISPAFDSAITNITTGTTIVVVTLADNVFSNPYSGTVAISSVVGTTEANGTWGYQAIEANEFQLYTDATLTTPVDGTTWTAYVSGGDAVGASDYTSLTVQGGNITVSSNDKDWVFNTNGAVIFPTLTVDLHNGGNQTAQTLQFGDASQQAIITGPTPAPDTAAQRLIIQGQRGNGLGEGGDVYLWAGDAEFNGGDIKIYAGDADDLTAGSGGYINLDGGSGFNGGGQISITGGYSSGGQGGTTSLSGGQGATDGGAVSINGGGGSVAQGGNVGITGGYGGANGGEVRLTGGSAGSGIPGYGNVVLVSGASTWTFDNSGNLTLPTNSFNVNYANGTQVPLGGGGNTGNVTFDNINIIGTGNLHLQPDPANTGSYLDIFLTSGPDLHLVASAAANLILGQDAGPNVMTSWDGNVYVQSWNTGSNTQGGVWNFGEDGNLILAGGNSVIQSVANSSLDPLNPNVSTMTLTPDANYNGQALVLDPTAPGHIHLRSHAYGSNIDEPLANLFLGGENTAFEITSGSNNQAVIHSNGKSWTFGNDGNITSDTLTFTTTFANVKTVEYQTAGVWDVYVEDSTSGPNVAYAWIDVTFKDNQINKPQVFIENQAANTGIPYRWTFDENGNLNFPRDVAGNSDPYLVINGGANPAINSVDVSLAGPANLLISSDYLNLTGYTGAKVAIKADNGEIATDANMVLTTNNANVGNTYSWTFDTVGNLSAPGNINFINGSNALLAYGANNYINMNNDGGMDLSCNTEVKITTNYGDAPNRAYSYFYANGTFSAAGNITTTGNITATNIGNVAALNLDGSSSNVLYGNGVFAAPTSGSGSNISNGNSNVNIATANGNVTIAAVGNSVVTITGTGANITGTANISGNANVGNLGVAAVVATANISTTGYFISGNQATGGFQLGNSNSRLKSGDSNSYMTMGQNPSIFPDTAASGLAGVVFGGNGYLLGNNGSRCITLNYGGTSGVVGLQANVQVGSAGSGTVLVPGTVTTGVNSILAGPTFTPLANTMAGFVSNVNSYTQLTIQNKSTGADATVDFVATADNGSDSVNYLDMGIINSGYDNATPTNSLGNIVFAADSYMYAQGNTSNASQSGGNLAIGTTVPGKNVKIFAGGVDNTAIVANIANTGVSITGNLSVTGNATITGTSSNVTRRAFGLVATDTYVQLDDLKAKVTSSNQLSLILASGSWQGTGWTQTFTSGSAAVSSWVNLPLSTGYDFASGAMNSQGNGCKCVISDQTPSAKVYEITVVRSGTSGSQWNISIERIV